MISMGAIGSAAGAASYYATTVTGKYGQFEIDGVPRQAIETFSTRRSEILAIAREKLDRLSPQGLAGVATRSRDPKEIVEDRDMLRQAWRDRAGAIGLDLAPLVDAARARAGSLPYLSRWEVITSGVKTALERASVIAGYVGERVGLKQPGLDPYLPRNLARMKPDELGAANAVASAVRQLS